MSTNGRSTLKIRSFIVLTLISICLFPKDIYHSVSNIIDFSTQNSLAIILLILFFVFTVLILYFGQKIIKKK